MELKDIAWNNARKIPGEDSEKCRKDACGARIHYDCYDQPTETFGWHIDHIFPQSVLRDAGVPENLIDHKLNVRALNIKNNLSKSDNYPRYKMSYEFDGCKNVEVDKIIVVNQTTRGQLKELYKDYISDFRSGDLNKKQ